MGRGHVRWMWSARQQWSVAWQRFARTSLARAERRGRRGARCRVPSGHARSGCTDREAWPCSSRSGHAGAIRAGEEPGRGGWFAGVATGSGLDRCPGGVVAGGGLGPGGCVGAGVGFWYARGGGTGVGVGGWAAGGGTAPVGDDYGGGRWADAGIGRGGRPLWGAAGRGGRRRGGGGPRGWGGRRRP